MTAFEVKGEKQNVEVIIDKYRFDFTVKQAMALKFALFGAIGDAMKREKKVYQEPPMGGSK